MFLKSFYKNCGSVFSPDEICCKDTDFEGKELMDWKEILMEIGLIPVAASLITTKPSSQLLSEGFVVIARYID